MSTLTTLSTSSSSAFIEANTQVASLYQLDREHLIPVFAKDNERCISHAEFVRSVMEAVAFAFPEEQVLQPSIRVSHPINGRTPEAKHKQPSELLPHEKTLYFERMMFNIEIPSLTGSIDGKELHLNVGGIKAFNLDKLHGKRSSQHFKVFVGFQVKVCSNLCVSSDGAILEFDALNSDDIFIKVVNLLGSFQQENWINQLQELASMKIDRQEFEQLIGRLRLQLYDPNSTMDNMLGDQQMGHVVRGYFTNKEFGADAEGNISLWNVYNLFTEANKSSYVDKFLGRSAAVIKLLEHQ